MVVRLHGARGDSWASVCRSRPRTPCSSGTGSPRTGRPSPGRRRSRRRSRCRPRSPARRRSADVEVRWVCTTMTTTSATRTTTPATMPPRSCAAAVGPAPGQRPPPRGGRPGARGCSACGCLVGTGVLLEFVVSRRPRARRDAGHRARASATSSRPRSRRTSSGYAVSPAATWPPLPKQPQSICSPRTQADPTAPMKTTSRTAAAIAAVRTKTPASRASPTAISTTGRPKATGATERFGQQLVGADRADGGCGVGHLERPGDDEHTAEDEPGGVASHGRASSHRTAPRSPADLGTAGEPPVSGLDMPRGPRATIAQGPRWDQVS